MTKDTEKRPGPGPRRASPAHWLTRSVLGIGLASLFCDLGHEMVTSLLPAFLASMGAAAGVLGTVEGCADGLGSAAKLYGGWLADRVRRRKPLVAAGYGFMALSPLVIAAATAWPVVALGRVLAWSSRGLRTPSKKALMADAVPPAAYGRAYGLERAMDTVGAIAAPLAVLLLLSAGAKARWLIALSAVPAFFAVLAIVRLVREPDRPRRAEAQPFWRGFRGFDRDFKDFLVAVGLFGLGDFADTFFILYAVFVLTPARGPASAAAWSVGLYALHNVCYAFCSYGAGWLADRTPKRLLLVLGYALAAGAAGMAAWGVGALGGLALMFAVAGAGVGVYDAVEDALAAELLPAQRRGAGFGVHAAVCGCGDWISSLAVGWLWALEGPAVAFGAAALVMAAGTARMAWTSAGVRDVFADL